MQSAKNIRESAKQLAELAALYARPTPVIGSVVHGELIPRPDAGRRERYARKLAATYHMDLEQALEHVVVGTPAEAADQLSETVDAGVTTFAFTANDTWQQSCDLVAELKTRLRV